MEEKQSGRSKKQRRKEDESNALHPEKEQKEVAMI